MTENKTFHTDPDEVKDPNAIQPEIHLDDVQRVKVLSPTMLVLKRFLRNQLAILGLAILIFMFAFSFLGGLFSPYRQQQVFRKYELIPKEYAAAAINKDLRYIVQTGENFSGPSLAQFVLAKNKGEPVFSAGDRDYSYTEKGEDFYLISELKVLTDVIVLAGNGRFTPAAGVELTEDFQTAALEALKSSQTAFEYGDDEYFISRNGKMNTISVAHEIALATKLVFAAYEPEAQPLLNSLDFVEQAQLALINDADSFAVGGVLYRIVIDEDSAIIYRSQDDEDHPFASVSNIIVNPISPDIFLSVDFKRTLNEAIAEGKTTFTAVTQNGTEETFTINRVHETYTVYAQRTSQLIDMYAPPSNEHLLGTDGNGMDVLTRLMYGGRISLLVGFVVVFFEVILGVLIGGVAGFFGGIIDTILMRIVDLFNSIPFYPIVIILGSVMDTLKVNPYARIFILMTVLGLLGWTNIARVVRGQILSLREQDFMVATEATGIRISRRIFRHLVPNVMPLLIVQATLALGNIIIIEATLSFLGLGVKYPIASWGNIINAATNLHVMTSYWYVWIPAGILIVLTVLGFNFVGDGLRDAFDPKMKR